MKIFLNETERLSSHTLYRKVNMDFFQDKWSAEGVAAQAAWFATGSPSLRLGVLQEHNSDNPEGWRHKGKPEPHPTPL